MALVQPGFMLQLLLELTHSCGGGIYIYFPLVIKSCRVSAGKRCSLCQRSTPLKKDIWIPCNIQGTPVHLLCKKNNNDHLGKLSDLWPARL